MTGAGSVGGIDVDHWNRKVIPGACFLVTNYLHMGLTATVCAGNCHLTRWKDDPGNVQPIISVDCWQSVDVSGDFCDPALHGILNSGSWVPSQIDAILNKYYFSHIKKCTIGWEIAVTGLMCKCVCPSWLCALFGADAFEAWLLAHNGFPKDSITQNEGEAGAWRHCYWSCMMARRPSLKIRQGGEYCDEFMLKFHEVLGDICGQSKFSNIDRMMDVGNNIIGRVFCSTDLRGCAACCDEQLEKRLIVLKPHHPRLRRKP